MARQIEPNTEVDPSLKSAIDGGGRHVEGTRDGDGVRSVSRKRKDKFYVPPELIPKGYVVEWKRKSCLGKEEDADYHMDLQDAGWKFATVDQFKALMPFDYKGKTIERGGMTLMIRPKHMKDEDLRLGKEEAQMQVKEKLTEIGMTGRGELPRRVQAFSRSFDSGGGVPIPDDEGN